MSDGRKLIALLQLAYSGELAAAYAYRGHWKSVSNLEQKTAIQKIENDEWRHREQVGEMLRSLESGADRARGKGADRSGRTRGVRGGGGGGLAPMYGAGRL